MRYQPSWKKEGHEGTKKMSRCEWQAESVLFPWV
jgi:hypothetical protein